ncbi:MAG: hypothetical protein LBK94_04670 [Prevotellaceae bacterium]|jgi:hypothetical protein|nr:hypothetical protein [Prevotellaceae bacterium]
MKVKNDIIKKIRENQTLKRELLYQMEWSETTLYRHLRENAVNGDLTKMSVLNIIASELAVNIGDITENTD